ncbi:MAG: DUF402 domain-containing protein [Methanocellales archaeon]
MTKIKLRGIYATALTRLFLDRGLNVVQPSIAVSKRFNLEFKPLPGEVLIKERGDKQGIVITGKAEGIEPVIEILRGLPDSVIREEDALEWLPRDQKWVQIFPGYICYEVEFPALSKSELDKVRDKVTPTVSGHHKFRIFASKLVDEAERELRLYPERRGEIELKLWRYLYDPLQKNATLGIEHAKLNGKVLQLGEGTIIDFSPEAKVLRILRRMKGSGSYDGLSAAKAEGDFAISTFIEGSWYGHHAYYSSSKELKGEYYNINTPVEFYPNRIRYLDLEVDVIVDKGEVRTIDKNKLEKAVEQGYINFNLAEKALEVAREIERRIR